MILTKQVQVLDKSKFKVGHFITYCYMQKVDFGVRVQEGCKINGIISYVDDKYFSVVIETGDKKRIDIEQLIDIENLYSKETKVKVLGIREYAF